MTRLFNSHEKCEQTLRGSTTKEFLYIVDQYKRINIIISKGGKPVSMYLGYCQSISQSRFDACVEFIDKGIEP